MDNFTKLASLSHGLSLSSFPLGLGLTAAAHVHLFNMSLTKTGEQQQRFHVKQQIRDIEMLVQSLSDMTNLTEIVDLLDTTLTRFQHNRKGAVHRRRVKRLDTHTTTKRSTAVQWNLNDSHHRHHHHQRRRSSISATSSSSSRGKERATENRKDKASKEPLPSESTTSPQDESFSGEEQNASKGKERENQTVDTPTSTKDDKGPSHDHSQGSGMAKASRPRKREPVLITTDDMGQWTAAYKKFRLSQEEGMKKIVGQLQLTEDHTFHLRNNLCLSFILGSIPLIRFLASSDEFTSRISRYFPRISGFLARVWHKIGPISPPSTITIPWRWSSSASSAIARTGDGAPSSDFLFLPLLPTLFIAGIHCVAFVRTQIVLDEIRKDYNDRLRFARRLSLLSAFLLIREKRLTWMVDEIKSYEEEQAQASENEVGHVMRNKIPRPKVLVQTSHQRVISLLHTERHNQGQQRELHRRLPSVDPSMFSFGPDLEAMDLDKFLQDPYERARIIRLELEAMREELLVFGKVIMKT